MEGTRKELLEKEIKMYEEMIKKTNQMIEEANTQMEVARLKYQKEQYKDYIRMDKVEIIQLREEDTESYLSGLDKLHAIQWYLREEKGELASNAGFQITAVKINENDDVVAVIHTLDTTAEVVIDLHDFYEKMKVERRKMKARELVDQILNNIDKLFHLVNSEEITQIRDTVYEAF